jgi:hypothetical protein
MIARLAGEGCLSSEDRVGIERLRGSRGNAHLSKEGPKFGGFDHRVGRQSQVLQAASRVEGVIESSQAPRRSNPDEFATNFVMCNLRDDDCRTGRGDGFEPS